MTADLYPGGRWHRILAALEPCPLKRSELTHAVRDPAYSGPVNRTKIWKAIGRLLQLGLIERFGDLTAITDAGRVALAELGPIQAREAVAA